MRRNWLRISNRSRVVLSGHIVIVWIWCVAHVLQSTTNQEDIPERGFQLQLTKKQKTPTEVRVPFDRLREVDRLAVLPVYSMA